MIRNGRKRNSKRKKFSISTFLLIVIMLAGLSLLLYPTVSDYWNSNIASHAVAAYQKEVKDLSSKKIDEIRVAAESYNEKLINNPNRFEMTDDERETYESLLDISGSGVMGYIEIPSIDVQLPIYHGTSDSVLSSGAGHLEGSSLPIGGKGTHTVITGHRGLPSARLFTDLDKLELGDTFSITVLDETLTYEVDQILTVLPDEMDSLSIDPDEDYVTLVTCTPYGINSHRLLVRGHRIENNEKVHVPAEAVQIDELVVGAIVAIPLTVVVLIVMVILNRRRAKKEKRE